VVLIKERSGYKAAAIAQVVIEMVALKAIARNTNVLQVQVVAHHKLTALSVVGTNMASTPARLFNSKGKIDKRRLARQNRKLKVFTVSTPIKPIDSDWLRKTLNENTSGEWVVV